MPDRFDNQNRSEKYYDPNKCLGDRVLSQHVAGTERAVSEGDKYEYGPITGEAANP